MKYGSVCSGIEAATVAWHPLGWKPAFFSEIEKFPRAVLAHHYPDVPCHGDFTTISESDYGSIDLLVGGTPCQAFSIAGLRKGFADERGNLTLEFIRLAERKKPRWLVWENVPGVLSQDGGRAFGSFLGGLAECGYGFAYRVLDAQYFGVPQRRRRVFVVGHLGNWRPAAAVLFERESLRGDITPSREAGEKLASGTEGRTGSGKPTFGTLMANCGTKQWLGDQEALTGDYHILQPKAYSIQGSMVGREEHNGPQGDGINEDVSFTLNTIDRHAVAIGWSEELTASIELAGTLQYGGQGGRHDGVMQPDMQVRRLTPRECERLQGFPDDYTLIPESSDSVRYKALGNSMAVPVMRWLGERINLINNKLTGDL